MHVCSIVKLHVVPLGTLPSALWNSTPGGDNILRRKSLVSTDTLCNDFVRQS